MTFRGPADSGRVGDLVARLAAGGDAHLVLAAPGTVTWPLPLYELALLTSGQLRGAGVCLTLVTPESRALELFGPTASGAVARLLAERAIGLVTDAYPVRYADGVLSLRPEGAVAADHVVALPRLDGPAIAGLPHDAAGFLPTDAAGRVRGVERIFAAGDATTFPIKQGGLAAQQADAAAETIAMVAGATVEAKPFRPVLRGMLLTGGRPLFARAELVRPGDRYAVSADALWWPPAKIVGRYLSPFLAARSGAVIRPALIDALEIDMPLKDEVSSGAV
jgi:sulfide:quinone oxidoreductase